MKKFLKRIVYVVRKLIEKRGLYVQARVYYPRESVRIRTGRKQRRFFVYVYPLSARNVEFFLE